MQRRSFSRQWMRVIKTNGAWNSQDCHHGSAQPMMMKMKEA
jgi:hypothetical protein